MKRLTYHRKSDGAVCFICTQQDIDTRWGEVLQEIAEKLCAYEDAEEQGLLLRLPCKVGDTVYCIEAGYCEYREKDACLSYCDGYDCSCPDYKADRYIVVRHFSLNDIASLGKTIFLTREEAEAALAKNTKEG